MSRWSVHHNSGPTAPHNQTSVPNIRATTAAARLSCPSSLAATHPSQLSANRSGKNKQLSQRAEPRRTEEAKIADPAIHRNPARRSFCGAGLPGNLWNGGKFGARVRLRTLRNGGKSGPGADGFCSSDIPRPRYTGFHIRPVASLIVRAISSASSRLVATNATASVLPYTSHNRTANRSGRITIR